MPAYPYICNECGHKWDAEFSTMAEHREARDTCEIECPKCHSHDVYRTFVEPLPIHYTSFGFFTTDDKPDKELRRRNAVKEKASEKKYY